MAWVTRDALFFSSKMLVFSFSSLCQLIFLDVVATIFFLVDLERLEHLLYVVTRDVEF